MLSCAGSGCSSGCRCHHRSDIEAAAAIGEIDGIITHVDGIGGVTVVKVHRPHGILADILSDEGFHLSKRVVSVEEILLGCGKLGRSSGGEAVDSERRERYRIPLTYDIDSPECGNAAFGNEDGVTVPYESLTNLIDLLHVGVRGEDIE